MLSVKRIAQEMDVLKKCYNVKRLKMMDDFAQRVRLLESQLGLVNVRVDHLEEISNYTQDALRQLNFPPVNK